MNKNLVQVQRPDRNGKMVTRWVRPDTATARKVEQVPPAAPASNRRSALTASDAIWGKELGVSVSRIRIVNYLEKAMPDVLDSIVEHVESDSDMAVNLRDVLELHRFDHETDEDNRDYLEHMLIVQPFTKKVMVDVVGEKEDDWTRDVMYRMEKIVRDMGSVSGPINADTTKAIILVALTKDIHNEFRGDLADFYLEHEADISYIADHIEEVEGVLPLLKERRTCDRKVIQELISTPSKAFTSGAL
jgi:hypothetical protein